MKTNETKPTIYVLIGPPCSGKSTWINKFLKNNKQDYSIISSDNHIERLAISDGLTYSEAWPKFIGQATAAAKQDLEGAKRDNKNIIVDQTNMSKKKRKSLLQGLDHYHKIAVIFDCDTKTLIARNEERFKRTGKNIPENVIKDFLNKFDPVTKDEGFAEIRRESS